LKQKLIRTKSLNNFIFIAIKEIYCIHVKNEIEKMFVHNVSENIKKCSAMHIRSMLLKVIIIAMQKIHLNEIYSSKDKIFQLELKNLRCQDVKMLIH